MWMVAVLKPAGNQAIKEVDVGMSEFLKNNEWASQHGLDGKLWTVDQRSVKLYLVVQSIVSLTKYSRTSVAQTGFGPRKLVPVKGNSSYPG